MRPSSILPVLLFACAFYGASAQIQQEFKTTSTSVIGYIEYIPKDYFRNTHNYPVVIFLHGLGQRGPNSTDPAVLKTGADGLVLYGPPMHVKKGKQFPFILISPQLKSNYGDWPGWYIMEVIEHVKTYLRIDPKRIYLTGSSLGGGGAWTGAQDYPDYFAAVAPVMGSWATVSKACRIAGSNLPVWAFHSTDDTVVPYSRSLDMVNAINACNPPIPARLRTYTSYGHNAYTQAYDIGQTYQSPNIYDWMMQWVNDHSNKIPIANAGADQSLVLPSSTITLTGGGSDTGGSITHYSWTQIGGSAVTLTNAGTNKLTISGVTTTGTYTFRLVVRDDKGSIASDDVSLFVKTSTNALPSANAGPDKTVNLPANSVTLTGSGSDADGYIASYAWSKISGGSATLSGATSSTLALTSMAAGAYVFRLTVRDDNGATRTDDVNVYVNYVPSVNAGADKVITLPTNSVTLSATASDQDGTIGSYAWSKLSGGSATLSGTSTANLIVSSLVQGEYLFRVTVKDNRGASKIDDVKVTVNPATGSNVAPTVSAGNDRLISLPSNSLSITATANDSDGSIASYQWTKLSGGAATLGGISTATLSTSAMVAGEYVFQVTVKDNLGASRSDDVKVTVNASPVVNAGADALISVPRNSVMLYGNATDADGTIASYSWSKISGGAATLTNATTKTLTASSLVAGTYVFRLTAKDNRGATKSDDVTVVVNVPPISNAGANKTITLPTTSVSVTGTGSDSDGTVAAYAWTKVAGGSATMSGVSSPTLSLSGLSAGTYTFRLTVTDNRGSFNYDDVTVIVNIPPSVNAGSDRTLVLPSNSLSLSGSATDPDGSITYYSWTKVSGGAAAMSGNNTPTLSVTGLAAGSYIFRLTAKDNRGSLTSDNVAITVNSSVSGASYTDAVSVTEPSSVVNDPETCRSCILRVYNEKLQVISERVWTPGAEDESFTDRGLYYFTIMREGDIIRSGKVFRE